MSSTNKQLQTRREGHEEATLNTQILQQKKKIPDEIVLEPKNLEM